MHNHWFARAIGIVPLGIGLTTLGFLWGMPWGQFGSPPLFFRLFGSFVALGFVMTGSAILSGRHPGQRVMHRLRRRAFEMQGGGPNERAGENYACTHCGAPLGKGADVSPHGDVRCEHCGKWFNVHHA